MNIIAGRATFDRRTPRVYAYVHMEVSSAAATLDQFLSRNGVTPDRQVSIISDDAGGFRKAVERIKALDARLLERQDYEFGTLWWNLRGIAGYVRNNAPGLVNYGARYRSGLPIGSSIAKSAVNQAVTLRLAKKRQTRWTDVGAHHLVQVRVAVLNGELSPSRLARLGRSMTTRSSRHMLSEVTQRLAA